MLHLLIEQRARLDYIVFFDTEWEFPAVYRHLGLIQENLNRIPILDTPITTIRNYRRFDDLLRLYGWPHGSGGWCAACKGDVCAKFMRAVNGEVEYIGFNLDEVSRAERDTQKAKKWDVQFPLIDCGFTGDDALAYCYDLGYHWDGLYKHFNRVSCFCCPKAGPKRIDALRLWYPDLYDRYICKNALCPVRIAEAEQPGVRTEGPAPDDAPLFAKEE